MAAIRLLVTVLVAGAALRCVSAQTRDFESELLQYLRNNISNFSPLLRPTKDYTRPTYITMDVALTQLVSVNSAKQSVTVGALLQAIWNEERLVWNPAQFGNLQIINWDASNIWFPVILVYNGIGDDQVLKPQMPVFLRSILFNTTLVTALWRREFEFSCEFDMTKFPKDKHACELEFFFSDQGRGNQMLIPVKNTGEYTGVTFQTTGMYRNNSEWKLLNASTFSGMRPYSLVKGGPAVNLPTFVISLEIERVSDYYFMNVITPLLLLTLLQVLVYFVPLESGEKLGFGITIMLSYTVFLLLLDSIVPKSQSTPAVVSFITSALVMSTISLFLTSIIMRLHFAPEGTRMSDCMHAVLIRCLARLFCVSGRSERKVDSTVETDGESSESSVKKINIEENPGAKERRSSEDAQLPPVRSDWVVAANALERLMVLLGITATVVIIGVFVIQPYI